MLLATAALSLIGAAPAAAFPSGVWTPIADMNVVGGDVASAPAPCFDNLAQTCIYVPGGSGPANAYNTVMQAYHPTTNTWTNAAPLAVGRYDAGVAAAPCPSPATGTCVYINGGEIPGTLATTTNMAYNPATNAYIPLAPALTARHRHASTTARCPAPSTDTCVYAVGGSTITNATISSVEAYNVATNTWSNLAPLTNGRWRHGLATAPCPAAPANQCIYAAAGNASPTTLEIYNPLTNTWAAGASLPDGHINTTAAAAPCADGSATTCVYVMGGITAGSIGKAVLAYDPTTNTWTNRSPMNVARNTLSATSAPCVPVATKTCIYVAGGAAAFGSNNIASAEVFQPGTSVPPLRDCTVAESRATERHWYFGTRARIDFGVSGTTATAGLIPTNTGTISEGTTVITDETGKLQFWSDGATVYNRNSVPMPNGSGLLGAPSATQTVAAFPSAVPGRYFVVTTNAVQAPGTLYYSIVDMTLNHGFGDVTATKNVQLGTTNSASEALNAIPNHDGTRFWVLTYTYGQPTMLAYEFNGAGPVTGTPVESTLSKVNPTSFGSINISADLTQIALLAGNALLGGEAHVLDFDASTGVASDTLAWTLPVTAGQAYTMDFSPSGDYVFVSRINPDGHLFRYKIAGAANGAAVLASIEDLGPSVNGTGGAVRRGPDGRMYEAMRNAPVLGVVSNPDSVATPTFVNNGFALAAGSDSQFGLPETVTGCAAPVLPAPARAAIVAGISWTLGNALPGTAQPTFAYGTRPLTPVMGDWNGDGVKTVGTFEAGTFKLNNQNDNSAAELTFVFGNPRGWALAGDYDGNGYDDVAVVNGGVWQIHYLGPGAPADPPSFFLLVPFGVGLWPNTVPVSGDWNGDGVDGIGTFRPATGEWVLKNTAAGGAPDIGPFTFGAAGSYPVTGDFGGLGIDTPGVRAGTTWTVRTASVTGGATSTFDFGIAAAIPLAW